MADLVAVTDSTFPETVLQSDKPVLVDFWAPWCGPCRLVGPVLEEIADGREDIEIVKLNVDDNPQVAGSFNVMSIPTMLIFKEGEVAHQIVGAMPKAHLEREIDDTLARA